MFFNYPMPTSGSYSGVYSSPHLREEYQELTMQEFKELVLHMKEDDIITEFLN